MKILKCPECGSSDIEYHEFGGWRQQEISLDKEGEIRYGKFIDGEVDDSKFHCNFCGHETSEASEIIAEEEIENGSFPITSIHRDDIAGKFGEAAYNITDGQMYYIAKKMADDYLNQLFWNSMEIIVEKVTGLKPKSEDD